MKIKVNYQKGDKVGDCIYIEERPPIIREKTETSKRIRKRRVGLFRCSCGQEFEALIDLVKRYNTRSCGCLQRQTIQKIGMSIKTHGKTKHPLYFIWAGMLKRCESKTDISYPNYGGRGIKVCKRWHDINNFIDDMYPTYRKNLQIDRIDNNGNYEPSNCRWVTRKQNSNNRRDNRVVEYKGMRKNVSEWAEYSGIGITSLLYRLNNWKLEDVFTAPYPAQGTRYKNRKVTK